jgi:hypothetical protein
LIADAIAPGRQPEPDSFATTPAARRGVFRDAPDRVARIVRALAAATLLAVGSIAGAVAVAQAPVAPAGNYGGGAVVAPPRSIYNAGNMLVGLRAPGDGRVQINAAVILSCSEDAVFRLFVTPAADGSFDAKGVRTRRTSGGGRVRTDYTIAGTIGAGAAAGTATARNAITRGGRTQRCPRATVRWQARRATGEIGLPAPAPRARLYGTTSQRLAGPRRAVVLRVSSDGAKLTRALYEVTVRCGSRTLSDTYDAPRRNLAIGADGSVTDVERFTFRSRTTIFRSVERFEAKVGAAGATGTFSTTGRLFDRRTGRTLRRCRSGTVSFDAAR